MIYLLATQDQEQKLTTEDALACSIWPDITERLGKLRDRIDSYPEHADPDDYRCFLDWYVCATIPSLEKPCRAFYADRGKSLKDLYSKKRLGSYKSILTAALYLLESMTDQNLPIDFYWEFLNHDIGRMLVNM